MKQIFNIPIYQLLIDEKNLRLICVGRRMHIFDINTMKKISTIGGFSDLSMAVIGSDKLYTIGTQGELKIFDRENFQYKASVQTYVHDGKIFINAKNDKICVWGAKRRIIEVAVVDLAELSVNRYDFPWRTNEFISYYRGKLYGFDGDNFYVSESFRVNKAGRRKGLKDTTTYGIYSIVGNSLCKKETIFETDVNCFNLGYFDGGVYDSDIIIYNGKAIYCKRLFKKYVSFVKKCDSGFIVGTGSKFLYKVSDDFSEKRKVCEEEFLSDCIEYGGHYYVGTWEKLVIIDDNDDIKE